MRVATFLIFLVAGTSCYTPIWMGRVPNNESAELHRGMIVFLQERVLVSFQLTQRQDEETGKVTDDCDPVQVDEIMMLPNTKEQYRIRLWQPYIGSSESGINLSNGVVTSVTQKADTKIPETIGAVAELASKVASIAALEAGGGAKVGGGGACNTGKRVWRIDGKAVEGGFELPKPPEGDG